MTHLQVEDVVAQVYCSPVISRREPRGRWMLVCTLTVKVLEAPASGLLCKMVLEWIIGEIMSSGLRQLAIPR